MVFVNLFKISNEVRKASTFLRIAGESLQNEKEEAFWDRLAVRYWESHSKVQPEAKQTFFGLQNKSRAVGQNHDDR